MLAVRKVRKDGVGWSHLRASTTRRAPCTCAPRRDQLAPTHEAKRRNPRPLPRTRARHLLDERRVAGASAAAAAATVAKGARAEGGVERVHDCSPLVQPAERAGRPSFGSPRVRRLGGREGPRSSRIGKGEHVRGPAHAKSHRPSRSFAPGAVGCLVDRALGSHARRRRWWLHECHAAGEEVEPLQPAPVPRARPDQHRSQPAAPLPRHRSQPRQRGLPSEEGTVVFPRHLGLPARDGLRCLGPEVTDHRRRFGRAQRRRRHVVGRVAPRIHPLVQLPPGQHMAKRVVVDVLVGHVVGAHPLGLHLDRLGDGVADAQVARGQIVTPHLQHPTKHPVGLVV
mmetsp:Transcript_12903/g.42208  ORF Transcript_12903/g.42208 Transcript_12903/m.42208 type:complete len:340 (+) Transcript_12903:419-1438(+)